MTVTDEERQSLEQVSAFFGRIKTFLNIFRGPGRMDRLREFHNELAVRRTKELAGDPSWSEEVSEIVRRNFRKSFRIPFTQRKEASGTNKKSDRESLASAGGRDPIPTGSKGKQVISDNDKIEDVRNGKEN